MRHGILSDYAAGGYLIKFKVRYISIYICFRCCNVASSHFTMVIVPSLLLALLPFVAASRLHKLKLHKVSPTNLLAAHNPELEAAYLAEKYGAPSPIQMPLLGLGGEGRVERPSDGNEPLFWTQEELKGGHTVPLTSLLHNLGSISQPL